MAKSLTWYEARSLGRHGSCMVLVYFDGRMSRDEAWEAIAAYNAAMLRPPWPIERLAGEAGRLWRLHVERNGRPGAH